MASSSRVEGSPPPPGAGGGLGKGKAEFSNSFAQEGGWVLGGGATDGTYNYCFQPEPDEGEGSERGRSFAVKTSLTTENSEAVSPIRGLRAALPAPHCPP